MRGYCGTRQAAEVFIIFYFKMPLSICKAYRVPAKTVAIQVFLFQKARGSDVHFSWLFFALMQASFFFFFLSETDG